MELERITDWLWCLRTPVVQAYAVRERDGFNLIDASTTGEDDSILGLLATLQPRVLVYDILLTHGHDDHTGSAAALAERTGARVVAPRDEAAVISGEQGAPHPVLADWEVPLFAAVAPNVPPRAAGRSGSARRRGRPARLGARRRGRGDARAHAGPRLGVVGARPVLVAGDALASHEGRPMVGVFNADPPVAVGTARWLATLGADVACFGHGEPLRHDAAARLAEAMAPPSC
jgi:glyoxylase-like metal-dependent hydrolase (beta-lactamase superfamily II)